MQMMVTPISDATALAKEKFPLWASTFIALLVFAYGLVYFAGLATIQAVPRVVKDFRDPGYILGVARNIAQFPGALPDGYQYKVGVSLDVLKILHWYGINIGQVQVKNNDGVDFLAIEHKPDGQQIALVSAPQGEPREAGDLLEQAYELGINNGGSATRFEMRKRKGELIVAGQRMPYIIGQLEGADGQKVEGLIGCISLKDEHRTVLVYGLQRAPGAYNLAETQRLLDAIQRF